MALKGHKIEILGSFIEILIDGKVPDGKNVDTESTSVAISGGCEHYGSKKFITSHLRNVQAASKRLTR